MRHVLLIMTALIVPVLAGCAVAVKPDCEPVDGADPDFGDFKPVPIVRIGSIPFPGLVSLYAEADPTDLGEHVYRVGEPFESINEVGRGVMYTCRAGFLDLAHVRNTIDNAAHIHARVRYALRNGRDCVRFRVFEPSVYRVEIEYPEAWWALEPGERELLADEVAVRAAETLAVHSMTWHEILSWYGHKTTVIISEKPSAFTYEDSVSHAVGAHVAGRAIRETREPDARRFGAAVTIALTETLEEIGAMGVESTREAVRAVRGDWWSGLEVDRRHVAGGVGGEPIEPWLVPGLMFCPAAEPEIFHIRPIDRLGEVGIAPVLRAHIDPRSLADRKILGGLAEARGLDRRPRTVDIEADFPVLLARIRSEIREKRGDAGLDP